MFNYMTNEKYRQTYDIMHTEPKQWNVPRLVLQLFLVQSVEARCEVKNENTAEAALSGVIQLHLSDQQVYGLLRCGFW